MKKLVLAILFIAFIFPVNAQTKKELKKEKAEKEYTKTKTLIDSGIFIFNADWATTQKGNRISLIGNPNFLKIDKENAIADLPYFGVSQSPSVGMTDGGGIAFEGLINDYVVEYNDKKQKVIIKFSTNNKTENFNVTLAVYKSGNANLDIISNSRNSISYDGKVSKIKNDK
ncbi:MAG: DUF4251 domain-containing protein [Bacteroidota bacterium]